MKAYLTLLKEKGLSWFICRILYTLKVKGMQIIPQFEGVFERKVSNLGRLDFFEYDVDKIRIFLKELPEEKKNNIIQIADNACKGRIKGFSSIELDYGYPIRWQLNPLTGESCRASDKWYQISDFDKKRGDIKVIWEASRFTHFFYLARAYLITNEEKYIKAYFEQISDWINNNKYSYGANYKCGQECAIRMVSCLFTYRCFSSLASEKDIENIKTIVRDSYKKILSNFFYAHRCIKNNHTISELVGMIIGAWCCSDINKLRYAYKTLDKVIEEQFMGDGGYTQLSFNYQRMALQDLEIILYASKKTGFSLSEESKNRILKCIMLLYQCQDTSGDVPNYGSNDGSFILPLTIGGYRDFCPVINTIHVMIEGYPIYDKAYLLEELLWFGLDTKKKYKIINRVSSDFPEAGIFTYRNSKYWLMVICKSRIGQMDDGHIDLWIDGFNVLCDAGTFSYASDLGYKLYTNIAHNTAYCVGLTQINRIGAFSVYGQPVVKSRKWSEDTIEFHIQYSTGYEHKRMVSVVQNGFEIFDEIKSDYRDCYILFHTVGNVSQIDSYSVKLKGCVLKFNYPFQLKKSKRSLYYLKEEDTTCIIIPCHNTLHTMIEVMK